jgi:7-carboxy-7-deazaguanine synthase
MPITLIGSNPDFKKEKVNHINFLNISEFFADTVQGENWSGVPSSFLRLQGCTLECVWCDTLEVWRYGNPYTFDEIFELLEARDNYVLNKWRNGQHLILTGGSPLKQQERLILFLEQFLNRYNFLPIIEVENECTLMPSYKFSQYVSIWNNSPKLKNSGMKQIARYKPQILKHLSGLKNSYFKFVVSSEKDWDEIYGDFIVTELVRRDQIVLMPEGQDRDQLQAHYEIVVDLAVREGIRMCDRMHVTIWNKKTGV